MNQQPVVLVVGEASLIRKIARLQFSMIQQYNFIQKQMQVLQQLEIDIAQAEELLRLCQINQHPAECKKNT